MSLPLTNVVVLVLTTHGPLPTADDLLKKLHAPRTGITRYEVVIDARGAQGSARAHLWRIWRDGDRYREDQLNDFEPDGTYQRRIDCTNGPEAGLFFNLWSGQAMMRPLDARRVFRDTRLRFEGLGATPEEVVNQIHERDLKWYVDRKEWTEQRVERCRWKQLPAYKLVLSAPAHPSKATYEVVFVPVCGFATAHADTRWQEQGVLETRASDSELIRVSGIWLPSHSTYSHHSGGKLVAELKQKVDYISLNKPVSAKAFSLEGMDLMAGTPVHTADGQKKWDGEKLVPDR